jgi:hypothetical protein
VFARIVSEVPVTLVSIKAPSSIGSNPATGWLLVELIKVKESKDWAETGISNPIANRPMKGVIGLSVMGVHYPTEPHRVHLLDPISESQ